ncbi:MAG: DUF4846 domain-containing protein [Bacillota bacterium]|jgi:hypothetical protein
MKKLRKLLILVLILLPVYYFYHTGTDIKNGAIKNDGKNGTEATGEAVLSLINVEGNTIKERVKVPAGYARTEGDANSFGEYLRNLPLKPHGSLVRYYNGAEKTKDVYVAVVDMEIGDRDLQQCADAVIRLRAEYLYRQGSYDQIHFNFVSGFQADYNTWVQGNRIVVNGNQVKWVKQAGYNDSYESFRKYLDMVFAYAGTASLAKELNPVAVEDMEIGDVFIQGGSPGHCVIVTDMAINQSTGEKVFLLAQSYMPAQDIQILKNPQNETLSPWYTLDFGDTLYTPEWNFNKDDLKRFE